MNQDIRIIVLPHSLVFVGIWDTYVNEHGIVMGRVTKPINILHFGTKQGLAELTITGPQTAPEMDTCWPESEVVFCLGTEVCTVKCDPTKWGKLFGGTPKAGKK